MGCFLTRKRTFDPGIYESSESCYGVIIRAESTLCEML